jgi:hypothetical protein
VGGRVLEGEKPVDLPSNLHFGVEPSRFVAYPTNDRLRRISLIAVRSGEGLLSDPIVGAQRGRRELLFMPHSGRLREGSRKDRVEWPAA